MPFKRPESGLQIASWRALKALLTEKLLEIQTSRLVCADSSLLLGHLETSLKFSRNC